MTAQVTQEGPTGRHFPLDTPLVILYVAVVTTLVLVDPPRFGGQLRILIGLPLLLFLPGYTLLAVLYPGRWREPAVGETQNGHATVLDRKGITWGERTAVSFAASLALIPLLAVLLSVARVPLEPVPITLSLGAVTVLGAVVGALRRLQLPATERFRLPTHRWEAELRGATIGASSRLDALLNVVLLLAVLAALTGLSLGLVAPPSGAGYTEAALLTGQNGELVAGNFTTEFDAGESAPLVLTVENQEGAPRSYTTVVTLERVRGSGESFSVVEREELTRLSMNVADNDTVRKRHTVTPSLIGDDLRLSYYLYVGDAPTTPSADTADKHLYLWLTVEGADNGTNSTDLQPPQLSENV